jgi:hypothetical protein
MTSGMIPLDAGVELPEEYTEGHWPPQCMVTISLWPYFLSVTVT